MNLKVKCVAEKELCGSSATAKDLLQTLKNILFTMH